MRDPTEFKKRAAARKRGVPITELYDRGIPKTLPQDYISDPVYESFKSTLPDNQRLTPEEDYSTHRYWELKGRPLDFSQAIQRGMYTFDRSDGHYHAKSVARDENGDYEFMKPKTHSTVGWETQFYYTDKDFNSQYKLIDDPKRPGFYKYKSRGYSLPVYDDGKTPEETYFGQLLPTVIIEGHKPTLWENIGNWFVDASKRAAFNENPAVMTASGWTAYPDGSTKQDAFNTPERNDLANKLVDIGVSGATDVWGGPLAGWALGKVWNATKNLYNLHKINIPKFASFSDDIIKASKDYNSKDVFEKMRQLQYNRMLNGDLSVADEPFSLISPSDKGRILKVPEQTKQILRNSTLPRLKEQRPWMSEKELEREFERWIDAQYMEVPESAMKKAWPDSPEGVRGWYNPESDKIVMAKGDDPLEVMGHEVRHRIDQHIFLTENEDYLLEQALGKEFDELPQFYPEMNNYKGMFEERVTTIKDAREALLGMQRSQSLPVNLQNQIIDKMPDSKILDAIENANGYGKRFVHHMVTRAGDFTPERIKAIREAMKHVGSYTLPTVTAAEILENKKKTK